MSNHFKKKILHRAKYRGIKELDIIFDRFIRKYSEKLLEDELLELIKFFKPDIRILGEDLAKQVVAQSGVPVISQSLKDIKSSKF